VGYAEGGQAGDCGGQGVDEGPGGYGVVGEVEVVEVGAEDERWGGRRADGGDVVAFEEEVAEGGNGGERGER
jgi:hypothetical protein